MTGEGRPFAQGESFCGIPTGAQVLDSLQNHFRSFGATHFLATGMPLPGRPIEPLLLRLAWGDLSGDGRTGIRDEDPVLRHVFRARRASIWRETCDPAIEGSSILLSQLGRPGHRQLILVPICAFLPYQGVVVGGGHNLALDATATVIADQLCVAAFRRLFQLGYLRPERPGELSGRERKVVELSATGKTAGQIAAILKISQRTVHAHLQNASEKLRAHNKTHTVVEALRYGQISV
jgi:LuxR family quorum sensing-dependent transcriptional regulator